MGNTGMKKRGCPEVAKEFAAKGWIHPHQEDLSPGALLWFSTYPAGLTSPDGQREEAPVWVPVVWLGWCEPFARPRGASMQWGQALFEGGKVVMVHRTRLRWGGPTGPRLYGETGPHL